MMSEWELLIEDNKLLWTVVESFQQASGPQQGYRMLCAAMGVLFYTKKLSALILKDGATNISFQQAPIFSADLTVLGPSIPTRQPKKSKSVPKSTSKTPKATSSEASPNISSSLALYNFRSWFGSFIASSGECQGVDDGQIGTLLEKLSLISLEHQQNPRKSTTLAELQKSVASLSSSAMTITDDVKSLVQLSKHIHQYDCVGKATLVLSNVAHYNLAQSYVHFCSSQLTKHPEWRDFKPLGRARKLREQVRLVGAKVESNFCYETFKYNLERATPLYLIANYLGVSCLEYVEVFTASKMSSFKANSWNMLTLYLLSATNYRGCFVLKDEADPYKHISDKQLLDFPSYFMCN
ncbi:hypothetical protein K493DRAFT_367326 [Basidiobolus meristosporus CBS 931.73]|uniref:Uncharacterized protein n=1 Tax=Basidiobolus meristosporus CBS 931.73 TaxID=1314790 RepID=A0A1Y1YKH4_9FUNG|nr:hypothetical protein K493DRAFT_367326 [Basidiobolus meristosporus CBS 931.73]|eukprot:ORX98515.1 hypothetical protein K493DRAFT_367326 [Basidiobolus meristosporus CBS 931.73]